MKIKIIYSLLLLIVLKGLNAQSYYFNAGQIWSGITETIIEDATFLPNGDRIYGITGKQANSIMIVRQTPTGNIVWAKEIQTGLSPTWDKVYLRRLHLSTTDTIIYLNIGSFLVASGYDCLIKMGTANGYVHYIKYYYDYNNGYPGNTFIEPGNGDLIYGTFQGSPKLIKYNAVGNVIWIKSFPANGYSDVVGTIYDQNNTYTIFSRTYNGTLYELMAVNFDSSGTINWAYKIAHPSFYLIPHDAIKIGNHYYVALAHNNQLYSTILKLDANMNVIDTRSWTSSYSFQIAYAYKLLDLGNGKFIVSCADKQLDGDPNFLEGLIIKLDTALNTIWMKNTNSHCSTSLSNVYYEYLRACDVDANGNLLFGGITRQYSPMYVITDSTGNDYCKLLNTTNIYTDTLTNFTTTSLSINSSPATMVNGTPLPTIQNFNFPQQNLICQTVSATACFSYTSQGGFTWNNSGIYTDHIPNSGYNGICDSLVIVNLTINTVDTSVTNNSPTLMANAANATYQWVDCNNNYSAIGGATNQTFTATSNGNYAVIVTQNGCTDTSACQTINNVGVREITKERILNVFPNPFSTKTTLQLDKPLTNAVFTLEDVYGQTVKEIKNISEQTITFNRDNLPSGIYFIRLTQDSEIIAIIKIVISD